MEPAAASKGDEPSGTGAKANDPQLQRELKLALDGYCPPPRSAFRKDLRAAFVSGAIEGDSAPASMGDRSTGVEGGSDEPSASLKEALDGWEAPAPRAEFRESLRGAFVTGSLGARRAGEGEMEMEGVKGPSIEPRTSASPAPGHARSTARRRSAPQPARRMSTQLRLLSGAGLLAAAAALVLILTKSTPSNENQAPQGGPSERVAQQDGGQDPDAPAAEPTPWSLDFGSLGEGAVLASVQIDGQTMGSIDALEQALRTASVIDVGGLEDRVGNPDHGALGAGIRIRHRDEYVLDLASGTSLELRYTEPESDPDSGSSDGTVFFAKSGSVRVATGPGFNRERPFVLRTPHVRTEVMGTIYGVDIGADYTCVCCLEGSVVADPCQGEFPALTIPEKQTRVLLASGERPKMSPLYGGHRGPLDALEGYWL